MFICVYSGDLCDYEIYLSLQCWLFVTDRLGCTDFRKEDKRRLYIEWLDCPANVGLVRRIHCRGVESGRVRRSLR